MSTKNEKRGRTSGELYGWFSGSHLASLAYFYDPDSFEDVTYSSTLTLNKNGRCEKLSLSDLCDVGLLHRIQFSRSNIRVQVRNDYGNGNVMFNDILHDSETECIIGDPMIDLRRLYQVSLNVCATDQQGGPIEVTVIVKDRPDLKLCGERFFNKCVENSLNRKRSDLWIRMHDALQCKPRLPYTEFDCIVAQQWFWSEADSKWYHTTYCNWCKHPETQLLSTCATKLEAHRFLGGYTSTQKDWVVYKGSQWEHRTIEQVGDDTADAMPLAALVALRTIRRWFTNRFDDIIVPWLCSRKIRNLEFPSKN